MLPLKVFVFNMSAREGLLQAPVQEAMPDDSPHVPSTGPFYLSEGDEENQYTGRWSDGLLDFFSDLSSCLMCVTPCLWPALLFSLLRRLQRIEGLRLTLPLNFGKVTHIVWLYAAAVAVALFVPHCLYIGWLLCARIVYDVYIQVAHLYKIEETGQPALQACFFHCCLLARLTRHVGRARGFLPPVMGFRVETATMPPPETIETTVVV